MAPSLIQRWHLSLKSHDRVVHRAQSSAAASDIYTTVNSWREKCLFNALVLAGCHCATYSSGSSLLSPTWRVVQTALSPISPCCLTTHIQRFVIPCPGCQWDLCCVRPVRQDEFKGMLHRLTNRCDTVEVFLPSGFAEPDISLARKSPLMMSNDESYIIREDFVICLL